MILSVAKSTDVIHNSNAVVKMPDFADHSLWENSLLESTCFEHDIQLRYNSIINTVKAYIRKSLVVNVVVLFVVAKY